MLVCIMLMLLSHSFSLQSLCQGYLLHNIIINGYLENPAVHIAEEEEENACYCHNVVQRVPH
jgi:hypothetical protein